MPQLIENKQNDPVLIANFEPNEIARKSEEKTKIQTRKHCAGEAAQKVEIQTRLHCAGEAAQKVEIQTRLHCAGEPARHGGLAQKEAKLSRANESSRALLLLQTRLLQLPGLICFFPGVTFPRRGWLWRGLRLRFLGRLRSPWRRRSEFVCRNG